jgi:hypothetical protein
MYDVDALGAQIGFALAQLMGDGFKLPIRFASVSTNGSFLCGTITAREEAGGLDCETPVMHAPDGSFAFPINMMFVDAGGEAARVLITGPDCLQVVH